MLEIKIMATAVVGTMLALFLKEQKQYIGIAMGLLCAMCIFFMGFGYLERAVSYVRVLYSAFDSSSGYMVVLLKITGVAVIATLASDLCSDAGMSAVSTAVIFTGKLFCLCMIFPVIENFFEGILSILP